MQLVYVADPLCSWCYGFGPELTRLLERLPQAKVDLVMGGLRPYNTERMSQPFREMLASHWKHVGATSHLPFNEALIASDTFIYDTEPACRAVVVARGLFAANAFTYMKAVQTAFYRDARDVTQPEVLADIAAESGYGRDAFLELLQSDKAREATRGDFAVTQSMGIGGFPTLAVSYSKKLFLVASGFTKTDVLEERLIQIETLQAAPQAK
ncbi:DsbA family protein [Usitatibacter palustris]|uniref:DSBA-like thioredoxin domain-containing protein n=1 Tax=Usitatibacter palustris TaxID=2732487 RepID=A0A6M4H2I1_9PROT|nr:DsbA family protein [Usitatibacter palustris]QJR13749.1 hypothetical protein DSM104440_00539 [Usitatibacter palustris]